MKIVVGLGNPGADYEGTRHNIGFTVVDRVTRFLGWTWGPARFGSDWAAGPVGDGPAAFMKPLTYMNLSGRAVCEAAGFYKIPSAAILVVCDDFNIPLGTTRYRDRGTSGGQKGLASILETLGTEDVPRLRLGVGPLPEGRDASDFVLSRFSAVERDVVERMAGEAVGRVLAWMEGKAA